MFHPRRFRTPLVISAFATLALLLLFNPRVQTTRVAAQSAQAVPPGRGQAYVQTNLMSDVPGLAPFLDPCVVNTWEITRDAPFGFPALVHTGTNTMTLHGIQFSFRRNSPFPLVTIPGAPPVAAALTHLFAFEGGNDFGAETIVFVSLAGEITAWGSSASNTARVGVRAPRRMDTGVTIADNPFHATAPGRYLYAADFGDGKIDVHNRSVCR